MLCFSYLCMTTFLCLPPSISAVSLWREQLVPPAAVHVTDPHSPPSPSISSARKVVLAHCLTSCHLRSHHLSWCQLHCHLPHSAASSMVYSIPFQVHRWMDLLIILICYAEVVFFFPSSGYGCPISCKSKGREKRNHAHHHDADITKTCPTFNITTTF